MCQIDMLRNNLTCYLMCLLLSNAVSLVGNATDGVPFHKISYFVRDGTWITPGTGYNKPMDNTNNVNHKTLIFPVPLENKTDNNETDSSTRLKDSDIWPFLTAVIIILAIIITISNAVMIIGYAVRPRIRLVLKVFVFNLCLVDFQNGFIALPLTAVYPRGTPDEWTNTVSGPACVFITFWPTSLVITAYLSIVLVTVERFVAILWPMKFSKIATTGRCICVVIFIWAYSICYSFMPIFIKEKKEPDRRDEPEYVVGCNGLYAYSEWYVDFYVYGILCVPLISVIIMYLAMYCVAHRHLKAIAAVTLPDPMRTQKDKRLLHHSKAAKTTFVMTFIFALCWLPFLVIMLLSDLCNFDSCPSFIDPQALVYGRVATSCLAFFNSAINPWIYGYRNALIKMEMRAMFKMERRTSTVDHCAVATVSTAPLYGNTKTMFKDVDASYRTKRSLST